MKNIRLLPGSGVNVETIRYTEYPLYSGKIECTFVARVQKDKGYWEFIEASKRLPDWHFTVIGDGEDKTIIDAFSENTCVEIEYSSLKDEISERTIEPRKLINYNNTWYVIAYDHRREDVRTFHLSRILSARTTGEPMTHDIQISDSGYGIYLTGSLAEYRIRFTGNAARIVSTQVWSSDQKMEYPGDGSLLLTVKSASIEELVPAVLSFGDEAEPVSPKSFVDSYKAKVRALAFREGLSNQSC